MGEKISEDAIFNAAVRLYVNFDERMGRVPFPHVPSDSEGKKRKYAERVADDLMLFYEVLRNRIASHSEPDK